VGCTYIDDIDFAKPAHLPKLPAMPRLLFIGSGNPWLGGAGYLVRQNLFLGVLSQVAELHLAMFDCKPDPIPEFAKSLTVLSKPKKSSGSKWKNLAEDFLNPLPRTMRGYDLTEPHRQVAVLNPDSFDAVFAFRIDFAYFAAVLSHPRLILDIDDPEHIRSARRLSAMGVRGDRRTLRDLQKLKEFEIHSVSKTRLAFVCQENDRQGWVKPPEVVPNCVVVPVDPPRRVVGPIVIFVGNCASGPASPNVDAVRYFLADIWPMILNAVPDAEFHLVGTASEFVRQLAAGAPRVRLRGFVDDLADVYAQASVSVAPIRFGTGTRIKILEAFAHACPVVSTLPGAEGIAAVPGRDIELAATASDFADRTISFLRDQPLAERIGHGGYELARAHYDVRKQQELLVARFRKLLDGKAAE
jgi:polysaccharide biosynthesis protein PslH